jgi:YCII-related domain
MSKFILLYRGPATPMEDITPEVSEQIMQAWGAWMGKVGDALVDGGAPFAGRTAVAGDGSATSASDLNGYTIVEAPDIDTAKALCDGNPFVSDGTATFAIEIYELVPM